MDPTFFHIQISFFVFKTLKAFFARSKVKITATAAIAIAGIVRGSGGGGGADG